MTTEKSSPLQVALFPIPQMVTFPGNQVPLHVFEPRYRVMIQHCLKTSMMLAIAHTKRVKYPIEKTKKTTKSLNQNQNQTTYDAHPVFSAGSCQVIETTEDGRMHIKVNINKRIQLIEIKQEIPFKIVTCIELIDEKETNLIEQCKNKMLEIYTVLLAISQSQSPQLYEMIKKSEWEKLTPAEFSFKIFDHFKFEPDFMQLVLEQTSVNQRLELIWQGIKQNLRG